jgi:hypothetical protein
MIADSSFVKHHPFLHALFNVKPQSLTGTVEGFDGSFVKHHPFFACII